MTTKLEAVSIQTRALKVLREEFGDIVTTEGGMVSDGFAMLRFRFQTVSPEQMAMILRGRFVQHARGLGLIPSDYDLPLIVQDQMATLVAVNPNRPKYPFTVELQDGHRLKISHHTFLAARARIEATRKQPEKSPKQTMIVAALKSNGKAPSKNGHAAFWPPEPPPTRKFKRKGQRAKDAHP